MTKNKKGTQSTVEDLAYGFIGKLTRMTKGFNEVILVFGAYNPDLLKGKN